MMTRRPVRRRARFVEIGRGQFVNPDHVVRVVEVKSHRQLVRVWSADAKYIETARPIEKVVAALRGENVE